MILNDIPDDDLIGEVSRRLGEGRFGWHGLMAPHQIDYHGAFAALVDAIRIERLMLQAPSAVWRLEARAREIIDSHPPAPVIYAINTTFHGKVTAFQDHAPRAAA